MIPLGGVWYDRAMRIFTSALVSIVLWGACQPALAQINPTELLTPADTIELQPAFPKPGETVSAKVNDYSSLGGSGIRWRLNGQVIPNGDNKREVNVVAGAVGSRHTLEAVLSTPQGGQRVLSTTILPSYLDIVIEPQTHVPDFYAGRALPSIGALVNATALLDTGRALGTDLIYLWRLNTEVLEGGPIRGRNQVSFEMPRGASSILSVQISRPDGTIVGDHAIYVPSVTPEMYFYEESSLYGQSHRPIMSSLALIGNSTTLRAEPYHLDTRVFNNPTIADWSIDGSEFRSPDGNPYQITIQKTAESSNSAVGFHVRDTEQVLQGTRGTMSVTY